MGTVFENTNIKRQMNNILFDIPVKHPDKFCRTCVHRERHLFNQTIIQYCGIRKSNRTENGKLKIKCKTPACESYKEDKP